MNRFDPGISRHDLLDVRPEAWSDAARDVALPNAASRLVADWSRHGFPVIVRRRLAGEVGDTIPVALQLPNAVGRQRIAVSVSPAGVTKRQPVNLSAAAASAPPAWNATVSSLLELAAVFGMPTVYGGLLWQHVSEWQVLRETSDLDLLWRPEPGRRRALLDALAAFDDRVVRLDGEIVLEDGGGVSWRELRAAMDVGVGTVAVKAIGGVELREVASILQPEHAPC